MKSQSIQFAFVSAALASSISLACGEKEAEDGTLGGMCYRNNTCNGQLLCDDRGICVRPGGSTTGGDGDGDASSGDGDGDSSPAVTKALEACMDCGADSCKDEEAACKGETGCMQVLECSLKCVGDTSCSSGCNAPGFTSAGAMAIGKYMACTTTSCASECGQDLLDALAGGDGDGDGDSTGDGDATGDGDSTGDGDATGDGDGDTGNTGEACTTEGAIRSSCTEGAPQACVDGFWIEESCEGCELVSPSSSCQRVSYASLYLLTDEDHVKAAPSDESFEQTADGVSASWTFSNTGYQQYGLVSFRFSSAISASGLALSGTGIATVTVETDDGSSGCEYLMNGATLVPHIVYDTYYGTVAWDGCWGSSADTRTVLNVRTNRVTSGKVSISVTGIIL